MENITPDDERDQSNDDDSILESVRLMQTAKTYIQYLPNQLQNEEYKKICDLVEKYIETHCKHNIVYDEIDIPPENSKTIRYCTHCYKTFK